MVGRVGEMGTENSAHEPFVQSAGEEVRKTVEAFRGAQARGMEALANQLVEKRTAWFEKNEELIRAQLKGTDVEKAYQLVLMKIGIDEEDAPIVEKSEERVVFHSMNFCPALEACKILGLDTREVCRAHSERATDVLVKKVNVNLSFSRNYDQIRPHAHYCEEIITLQV